MNDLAPMNVRTEPRDDVRRTTARRTVREGRQGDGRFVAARPASVPLAPTVTSLEYAPSPSASAPGLAPARPVPDRAEREVRIDGGLLPGGGRAALLIGTAIYDHDDFPELASAGAGVRQMKHVLERPDVGMMDTCLVVGDATRVQMMRGIEAFLEERESDDTVVVYVSGYAVVSRRDGRQYLVAKDTDPADLERTAVPVDFLSRQLRECRADGKIALLDHRLPPTWTTTARRGVSAAPGVTSPGALMPEPAGVHVIAASPELCHRTDDADGSPTGASAFTAEIVEGLGTGRVTSGLGPWVTADDLADYLTARLQGPDASWPREPATSTLAVTGGHIVARSAVRALSLLGGDDGVAERTLSGAVPRTTRWSRDGRAEAPGWRELAAYYRACLADSSSPFALPPRDATPGDHVPIGSGAEVLLCGASATAPAPGDVDTFDWKERELWYGYPLVTLAGGGRRHSGNPLAQVGVAPLLVQRVDVTVDSRGAPALRPTGPVLPHAGVVHACVDEQEAAGILASWRPGWEAGDRDEMLAAVRQLMTRLGLSEANPLDPGRLSADGLASATRTGVHNAAGVVYAESRRTAAVATTAELAAVAEHAARVPGTALEHLGTPAGRIAPEGRPAGDGSAEATLVVTPDELNESQAAVLDSAMRRPLTVATTPPGTGEADLIVDVVATAVAAGQKVLVVAAHDRSLTGVVERCAQLAPGLLIRTGDAQARAEEKQLLRELLRSSNARAPRRPGAAVAAELSEARAAVRAWRERLAEHVRQEATLRKTYAARAAAAERLGVDVAALEAAWDGDDTAMATWLERARSLDEARFLHDRRRGRAAAAYLRAVPGDVVDSAMIRRAHDEPEVFHALVLFARAELRVREIRRLVGQISDEQLEDAGHALTERCRQLSGELVDAVMADRSARAQAQLDARRMALEPGGRARQASQRELAEVLGGWAVTLDSAEQLAMEPGMFDLVVVADAHEASVASVLPVLFRARRALVLGDPARRRPAGTISDHRHRRAREQGGLSASWLEQRRLTYQADSAFDAAAARVADVALLDEHDGCHPGIARIVDESLYAGRLTVRTDVRSLRRAHDPETGQSTLLLWEDVQGSPEPGPNGGSWRNQAEIDRVVWAVNELRDQLPAGATIGVMTPFRAQAEELRSLFRFEPVAVACADDPEPEMCDAMVLSLVAGEAAPAQIARWVESRAAMWNACLTRARSHVVTVGRHQFWAGRSGLAGVLARQSSVRSFHVRPVPPQRPEPVTEPDGLADLLEDRLRAAGYTRIDRHAVLDGYRCDLLVATADGATAVLLDRGAPAGEEPARHLRSLLRRRRLLVGTQPDTDPPIGRVTQVLRVPAWRVRAGESVPGLI